MKFKSFLALMGLLACPAFAVQDDLADKIDKLSDKVTSLSTRVTNLETIQAAPEFAEVYGQCLREDRLQVTVVNSLGQQRHSGFSFIVSCTEQADSISALGRISAFQKFAICVEVAGKDVYHLETRVMTPSPTISGSLTREAFTSPQECVKKTLEYNVSQKP